MSSTNFAGPTGHHEAVSPDGERPAAVYLPKKLIVCCDGTWMDSDNSYTKGSHGKPGKMQNPTNVTRIARAISAEDDAHHPQIVYYQAGVGTGFGLANSLLGGGTGLGLAEHIREAYAFLVNNFKENRLKDIGIQDDSIFILGFSRGAFTARSIAGLIGAVGLLKKKAMPHFYEIFLDWENAGNHEYTPQFWDGYFEMHPDAPKKRPDINLARDLNRINDYMREYMNILLALDLTQDVNVNAVGVWDTVGALGIPVNPLIQKVFPFLPSAVKTYSWFDTGIDQHIKNAFHALALDEHRYPFSPTLWEKPDDTTTNLKQVWFPGAHSNVGGSYADQEIADITLAWMMDQLSGYTTPHPDGFQPREWIKFDENYVQLWEKNIATVLERKENHPYKGFGMGYLYESMYFPMSLLGKLVRSPGCYHRTDFVSGKPTPKLLKNTNEFIHSCVRARIDMGGRDVENDWSSLFPHGLNFWPVLVHWFRNLLGRKPAVYQPMRRNEPLEGWELKDGHKSHLSPNMDIDTDTDGGSDISWVYKGNKQCSIPVMKEDVMGPFQKKLLQKDRKLAADILESNDGSNGQGPPQKPSPNLAHTF